jgi:hypothetical protein
MGYHENKEYTVFEMESTQYLDLKIDIGKSVSQIAAGDPDVIYRQNSLYAGKDETETYYPIGDVIQDGKLIQQGYGKMKKLGLLRRAEKR